MREEATEVHAWLSTARTALATQLAAQHGAGGGYAGGTAAHLRRIIAAVAAARLPPALATADEGGMHSPVATAASLSGELAAIAAALDVDGQMVQAAWEEYGSSQD